MLVTMLMLAQVNPSETPGSAGGAGLAFPSSWPHQADLVSWCVQMSPEIAALFILLGIVYLLFGFQIFKPLVLFNAAVVGGLIGAAIGENLPNMSRYGEKGHVELAMAVLMAIAAAAVTWPTMKYAVALMGGLFGAALGASIWGTLNLDPHFAWAGAMTGLVAFGLLSFILFRGSVIMYTSLQGAFMLVFGTLGLALKYKQISNSLGAHMSGEPILLPAAIFIPALLGLIFQQHNTAAHGGGSGGGGGKK